MTKAEAEARIREMYAARRESDLDAMAPYFHGDVVFAIEGLGVDDPSSVATRVEGRAAFLALMPKMRDNWRWRSMTWRDLLIDDDRFVARYMLDMEFTPLHHRFDTEVIDFGRLKDGKIVELVEYVDTATASALIASATPEG